MHKVALQSKKFAISFDHDNLYHIYHHHCIITTSYFWKYLTKGRQYIIVSIAKMHINHIYSTLRMRKKILTWMIKQWFMYNRIISRIMGLRKILMMVAYGLSYCISIYIFNKNTPHIHAHMGWAFNIFSQNNINHSYNSCAAALIYSSAMRIFVRIQNSKLLPFDYDFCNWWVNPHPWRRFMQDV